MSKIFRIDWYPHQAHADYTRLDAEEIALMSQIINLIYIHEGPIDNDPKWICRSIKNMGPAKCRNIINRLLENEEISLDPKGKIFKKMCQNQLETVTKRRRNVSNNEQTDGVLDTGIEQNQPLNNPSSTNTSTSTSISTSRSKEVYTSEFENFWKSWIPYKTGKGSKSEAFKFYKKSAKEISHEKIIECSRQYCQFCQSTDCNTKNVFRWLDKRGWEDDYEIPAKGHTSANGKESYSSQILTASERAREQLRLREEMGPDAEDGNARFNDDGIEHHSLLPSPSDIGPDTIPFRPLSDAQEDGWE